MKLLSVATIMLALLLALSHLPSTRPFSLASDPETYVYYGYAPPTVVNLTRRLPPPEDVTIYNYTRVLAQLDVIGIHEGTSVDVWNLTDGRLIASFTVNAMEVRSLSLGTRATGTTPPEGGGNYVKVVSDKLVSILMSGGGALQKFPYGGLSTDGTNYRSAFYPGTDGGYAGKEFIFKPLNGTYEIVQNVWEWDTSLIFGVQNAHVTIYDKTGTKVTELDVPVNAYRKVVLRSDSVYRLVSTGRVMVAGICSESFVYAPSATGGFRGKNFYGGLMVSIPEAFGTSQSFVIVAQEDSEVSVYDLSKPGWQISLSGPDAKKTLRAGEYWYNVTFKPQKPLRVDSTGEILVIFGRGGYYWGTSPTKAVSQPENMGDDVKVIGAKAGEELNFFAPTSAVVFSHEDAEVAIDGGMTTMRADSHLALMGGMHTIRATGPLTIEVLSDANMDLRVGAFVEHHFDSWATYLMPTQSLEVVYPPPPAVGNPTELIAYLGAIAAIPIIILAVIIVRRRRAKKPRGSSKVADYRAICRMQAVRVLLPPWALAWKRASLVTNDVLKGQ